MIQGIDILRRAVRRLSGAMAPQRAPSVRSWLSTVNGNLAAAYTRERYARAEVGAACTVYADAYASLLGWTIGTRLQHVRTHDVVDVVGYGTDSAEPWSPTPATHVQPIRRDGRNTLRQDVILMPPNLESWHTDWRSDWRVVPPGTRRGERPEVPHAD